MVVNFSRQIISYIVDILIHIIVTVGIIIWESNTYDVSNSPRIFNHLGEYLNQHKSQTTTPYHVPNVYVPETSIIGHTYNKPFSSLAHECLRKTSQILISTQCCGTEYIVWLTEHRTLLPRNILAIVLFFPFRKSQFARRSVFRQTNRLAYFFVALSRKKVKVIIEGRSSRVTRRPCVVRIRTRWKTVPVGAIFVATIMRANNWQ